MKAEVQGSSLPADENNISSISISDQDHSLIFEQNLYTAEFIVVRRNAKCDSSSMMCISFLVFCNYNEPL